MDEDDLPQIKSGPKVWGRGAPNQRPEDRSKSPVLYKEAEQENTRQESLMEKQGTYTRTDNQGRRQRSPDPLSDRRKAQLIPRVSEGARSDPKVRSSAGDSSTTASDHARQHSAGSGGKASRNNGHQGDNQRSSRDMQSLRGSDSHQRAHPSYRNPHLREPDFSFTERSKEQT